MIRCVFCKRERPYADFSPSAAQWPDRGHWCKDCNRSRVQIARHGLTAEQRVEVAAAQGGCRICGHSDPSARGWVVDHDHECCSGEKSCPKCRRGVICHWCNTMLGNAFDRRQTLLAAVTYLDAPRTCEWHMPVACSTRICDQAETASCTDGRRILTEKVLTSEDMSCVSDAHETGSAGSRWAARMNAYRYAVAT